MNGTFQFGVIFKLEDIYPNCIDVFVPILGYVFPVFAVLVTAGSVLASVVFLQARVRSHTTYILTLIACTDALNILFPSVTYVYYYALGYYKDYFSYGFCFWSYITADVCVDFLNALSLWLTVLLAYIRFRCLKSPFNAHNMHTSKRIATYVACIFMFTVISHIPSLFLFEFSPAYRVDQATNATQEVCVVMESNYVFSNSSIGRKVQVCTASVLHSVVPCFILVYLNFAILVILKEANQSRSSLRRGEPTETKDLDASRRADREINLDLNCCKTLFKCKCFGNVAENNLKENSAEKNETVVFHDMRDKSTKSLTSRNNFWPNCLCGNLNLSRGKHTSSERKTREGSDSIFDKLDRESRRTSWLILTVAAIISLHEIPSAIANTYILIKHAGVSLPINIYGCFSVVLLFWQYITYLVIFLIYAFMSGAFREEFKRIFTSKSKSKTMTDSPKKLFMSPCSVRKAVNRTENATAGSFQDSDF